MLPMPDGKTAVPISQQPSLNVNTPGSGAANPEATPVLALKELVASLHREQNKIQNLLSSLGFALRSFNNLNQFLELTPLMAARVTDAEVGALILSQPDGSLRLEQLYSQNSTSQKFKTAIEQAIRQATTDKASAAPTGLPALDQHIRQQLEKTWLIGTPILVKKTERGRLYVLSSNPEYQWTQTRQKLVQLVADQTAVAIANHELTVELRSRERQDRELEIASEIQLRLLPRKCPTIQGVELAARCKTASRVGGDYYDFIPANYDKLRQNQAITQASGPWSIVIGDVMGKGVPAGLIMTMTRGMLRAEVLNRHSPARILQHLNRVMYADLENSHRFVTLFYSEYDPQTGTLVFSNAAHNPPLLWQAKSRSIVQLDTVGMLIGLDADSQYDDDQVQLTAGDKIIYYTDGFTDVINQNGDHFDEENLRSAFSWACQQYDSSQAILDYLFEQVEQFIGSGNIHSDDMTLIVMQIKV